MQDLSALIAPRQLLIINGEKDNIFPIEGVQRGFKTVQEIYQEANAPENCRFVLTQSTLIQVLSHCGRENVLRVNADVEQRQQAHCNYRLFQHIIPYY
jgi:hypothetical protein